MSLDQLQNINYLMAVYTSLKGDNLVNGKVDILVELKSKSTFTYALERNTLELVKGWIGFPFNRLIYFFNLV